MVGGSSPQSAAGAKSAQRSSVSAWIPTALSIARIPGAFIVVGLAIVAGREWFLISYFVFVVTDWIDGPLARWLKSTTPTGAKLDTIGDVMLSVAAILGCAWLRWDLIAEEWAWVVAAAASYVASGIFSLWKFGGWPSYHTLLAKISWPFVLTGVVFSLWDWSVWPLRVAAGIVTLGNLEAVAITAILNEPRSNVLTVFSARGSRRD